MTTTDNSFVANGPARIGFETRFPSPRAPFRFGALAVGRSVGVYGAIDDIALPPAAPIGVVWDEAAVVGTSTNKHGVFGSSSTLSGVIGQFGVKPTAVQPLVPTAAGVTGLARNQTGVVGASDAGNGVRGLSHFGTGIFGHSVAGVSFNAGVFGVSGSFGLVPGVAGVVGTSDLQRGVIGTSNAHQGVYGFSTSNAGVVGESGSPQSFGGYFFGNVMVTGTLTAAAKNGMVVFPDASKRVLHCMESPEHWFEDFGAGKLERGRAVVKIDADFAKVIKRGDYHVFLTPRGDCRGLYVRSQGAASFEVRELAGGKSSVAFSYRIIGRRKDIKAHRRFAKIDTRLRLPVPPARTARAAGPAKIPRTPAELRAFAARMEKLAAAQMRKRGRKRKGSAR